MRWIIGTRTVAQKIGLGLILAAALVILLVNIPAVGQAEVLSLVQIETPDRAAHNRLAALELDLLGQAAAPSGSLRWFALADAAAQARLETAGLDWQVRDSPTAGQTYLIAWRKQAGAALPILAGSTRLLADEGNYLLLAVTDEVFAQVHTWQTTDSAWLGYSLQALANPTRLAALPPAERSAQTTLTADPRVAGMLAQVQTDDLHQLVGDLSGEWEVTINGNPTTILTRYSYATAGIDAATEYAHAYFTELGLLAYYDYYLLAGGSIEWRNVIGEMYGTTHPERLVLVIGHIDSISQAPYVRAPGADDNASGSAGVLLAAKILSQYPDLFGNTIRFVLFTGEEQLFWGSEAYARSQAQQGAQIVAVLNLDMIGYNGDSNPIVEMHTRDFDVYDGDQEIAETLYYAVSAYNLPLTVQLLDDAKSWSDHSSFWKYGFPAALAMEDWEDLTPDYHSSTDRLNTLDMSYFTAYVKAAIATTAHLAEMHGAQAFYLPGLQRSAPAALSQGE